MPSIDTRTRSRKKGRLQPHTIPSSSATISLIVSSWDSPNPVNGTQPSSSSSDERKFTGSISNSSLFDDEQWRRSMHFCARNGLKDTVLWGYCLLGMTWLMGIGGVCGIWEWSLKPIQSAKTRMVRLHYVWLLMHCVGNEGRWTVGYEQILYFFHGAYRSCCCMDMGCTQLDWHEILST